MNTLRYTLFVLISTLYIGHNPLQASSNDDQFNKISRLPSQITFNNQPGLSLKNIMLRIEQQDNAIKQQNLRINNLENDKRQLKENINKLTQDNKQKDMKINELEKKQGGSSTGFFVGVGTVVVAVVGSIAYLAAKAGDKDDND